MRFEVGPSPEVIRAAIKAAIDAEANVLREGLVTAGQEMTYILQEQEAQHVLSGSRYAKKDVPHIAAEAKATGSTLDAAAALILQRAAETRAGLAAIKGKVRTAKLAVDAAGSISEARRIAARAFKRR